jgi:hypothetical protein
MASITFSVAEFVAKLRAGSFVSNPLVVTGFVKLPEEGDVLLLAQGHGCTNWNPIALPLIERVEFHRVVPCKDHSHPLVSLTLAQPESEEAQTFANIAKMSQEFIQSPYPPAIGTSSQFHGLGPHVPFTMFNAGSGSLVAHALLQTPAGLAAAVGDCPKHFHKCWDGTQWTCCPDVG